MKHALVIFLASMLFGIQANAQYRPLQIGEKMPDFEFAIKNYKTPTARISDFKGKLVFFDFWSTGCSSCIAGFPKMERIQKEFGDKIIIILVNIRETSAAANARLKERRGGPIPQLSSMPSIIDDEAFAQLFPHYYAGNYVWIDPKGIVRLNASPYENLHSKKLQQVLDGEEISFLQSGKFFYGRGKNEPTLLNMVNDSTKKGIERINMYSLVSPVNLDYYGPGGEMLDEIDTVANTIRNTYINRTVTQLYSTALEERLKEEWKSLVYGPYMGSGYRSDLNQFKLLVKDTSLYDKTLLRKELDTDEYVTRSLYCYEQVLPKNTSAKLALSHMHEDLNRYFSLKYGCKVTIEEVEIPCYYLKKANNPTILSRDEIKKRLKNLNFKEEEGRYSPSDYKSLMDYYFRAFGTIGSLPYVFLDGLTPVEIGKLRLELPAREEWEKGGNLQRFQQVLELNNLKLVKGTKKINMIVIRD